MTRPCPRCAGARHTLGLTRPYCGPCQRDYDRSRRRVEYHRSHWNDLVKQHPELRRPCAECGMRDIPGQRRRVLALHLLPDEPKAGAISWMRKGEIRYTLWLCREHHREWRRARA